MQHYSKKVPLKQELKQGSQHTAACALHHPAETCNHSAMERKWFPKWFEWNGILVEGAVSSKENSTRSKITQTEKEKLYPEERKGKGKLHRLGFIKIVLYRKHDVSIWSQDFGIAWKQQAQKQRRQPVSDELFRVNPVQHKERKPTTQNFTLSLDTGGVKSTQKVFLNAFLNCCVNEAPLPKMFNYYIEILSEMAHIIC